MSGSHSSFGKITSLDEKLSTKECVNHRKDEVAEFKIILAFVPKELKNSFMALHRELYRPKPQEWKISAMVELYEAIFAIGLKKQKNQKVDEFDYSDLQRMTKSYLTKWKNSSTPPKNQQKLEAAAKAPGHPTLRIFYSLDLFLKGKLTQQEKKREHKASTKDLSSRKAIKEETKKDEKKEGVVAPVETIKATAAVKATPKQYDMGSLILLKDELKILTRNLLANCHAPAKEELYESILKKLAIENITLQDVNQLFKSILIIALQRRHKTYLFHESDGSKDLCELFNNGKKHFPNLAEQYIGTGYVVYEDLEESFFKLRGEGKLKNHFTYSNSSRNFQEVNEALDSIKEEKNINRPEKK